MTFQKGHKISSEVEEKRRAGVRRAAQERRAAKEAKLVKKGIVPRTEPALNKPGTGSGGFNPPSGANHNILTEINLKGEFDKMSEKINPKKTESGKDMKYECGACGHKFNTKGEGGVCPGCGVELE